MKLAEYRLEAAKARISALLVDVEAMKTENLGRTLCGQTPLSEDGFRAIADEIRDLAAFIEKLEDLARYEDDSSARSRG